MGSRLAIAVVAATSLAVSTLGAAALARAAAGVIPRVVHDMAGIGAVLRSDDRIVPRGGASTVAAAWPEAVAAPAASPPTVARPIREGTTIVPLAGVEDREWVEGEEASLELVGIGAFSDDEATAGDAIIVEMDDSWEPSIDEPANGDDDRHEYAAASSLSNLAPAAPPIARVGAGGVVFRTSRIVGRRPCAGVGASDGGVDAGADGGAAAIRCPSS